MPVTEPDAIAQRCLQAFTQVFPGCQAAFYRIDPTLQARDFHLHDLTDDMHRDYLDNYRAIDPLQPSRCLASGRAVVPLQWAMRDQRRHEAQRYREFLQRYEVADVVEVIACDNTRPKAAISLMRSHAQGPFTETHYSCLAGLQSLLELAVIQLPNTANLSGLTPRERQIATLLSEGASNKHLAKELNIGLATIKTHLLHLFQKVGVSSRTELVSRLFL